MSKTANWAYKRVATVWRQESVDRYGQLTFSAPEVIKCYFSASMQMMTDSMGNQFTVNNRIDTEAVLEIGDYILVDQESDILDPIQAGAKEIKAKIQDANIFDKSPDDFKYFTGV